MESYGTWGQFIGRARELELLASSLEPKGALVSLVGPPGVGKTRIVSELLHTREDRKSWFFVDLTSCRESRETALAIGAALGLAETPAEDLEDALLSFGDELARRNTCILVLDNCEHLLDEVRHILTSLSENAPLARFLATSREKLGIEREQVIAVEPLAYPQPRADKPLTVEELRQFDAARLFESHARLANPNFSLRPEEIETLSEILRALDGNPLSIELCAARTRLLGTAQILRQLERRFDLLRSRAQRESNRWSSLEGSIEWSWELLDQQQQHALALLSVFRGGCSLEAIRKVYESCRDTRPSEDRSITELLEDLRRKSLLQATKHEGRDEVTLRYFLLESIRAFARARLSSMGLEGQALRAHADFFLSTLGPEKGAILIGGSGDGGVELREQLQLENGNLTAVTDRALAGTLDRREHAVRALIALAPLCCTHGPFTEYLQSLERARDESMQEGTLGPLTHAGALVARALVESRRGRYEPAIRCLEEALPIVRKAKERWVEAYILIILAGMLPFVYRGKESPKIFERARRLVNKLDDDRLRAILHKEAASFMMWRAPEQAEAPLKKALMLFRLTGDVVREAYTLGHLCTCRFASGAVDDAERAGQEALSRLEQLEDKRWSAHVRSLLALIAQERGDFSSAEEALNAAVKVHLEGRVPFLEAFARLALSEVWLENGRPEDAHRGYSQVLEIARPLEERMTTAWALAGLAVAESMLGRLEVAEQLLEEASEIALRLGDESLTAGIELRRGHVELARARDASLRGANVDTQKWLERARERAARATALERPLPSRLQVRLPLRLLRDAIEAEDRQLGANLRIDRTGQWFAVENGKGHWKEVSLKRKNRLRRLLCRLADQLENAPGRGLSLETLFSAGWPGERVNEDSAANRVYVSLTRLRNLGLGSVLTCSDSGFLLDPEAPIKLEGRVGS